MFCCFQNIRYEAQVHRVVYERMMLNEIKTYVPLMPGYHFV